MVKKKKRTIIKVDTIDEAKKEVLKLVKQGVAFRDIAKITFQIDGRQKHFNISEISKIKNGTASKEKISVNIDNDMALIFRELKKEKRPVDLVIETGLNPDIVEQAVQKFAKLNDMDIIPKKLGEKIVGWIEVIKEDGCFNPLGDSTYVDDVIEWYSDLNPTYPCRKCRKPIRLDEKSWEAARKYLISQGWGHVDCD